MPPARTKRPPNGLEFPVDSKGGRSTTEVNQSTAAAAIRAVSAEAAEAVKKQRGWRFAYSKHLVKQVELAAQSPDNALAIASAGLEHLHQSFEFIREGKTMSVAEAMSTFTKGTYETGVIRGTRPQPSKYEFEVPYHGKILKGDALRVQLDQWVTKGVIELSCGASLTKVIDTPTWLDMSDKYVVLLGASSAMGPLPLLLALGANVIAIDLNRPQIWTKLLAMAKESCGTLIFPLTKPQKSLAEEELAAHAGCDLLSDTPEIRNWLLKVCPKKQLTVGAYAYLDGPLFVRVSMAMDAIIQDLVKQRQVALAYLCTPTDAHIVPAASVAAANANKRRAPLWQHLFALLMSCTKSRMARNTRKPVQAEDGEEVHVVDAIVNQQGPNYILAKRLQHWRAISARAQGSVVSSNIAPSTATLSVLSNFSFKLAYGGMPYFKPMEVFEQDTSNAVMGGLLINDLCNEQSPANPAVPLRNPMNLFTENSFHGGAWRMGYKFNSIGTPSVVAFLFVQYIVGAYLLLYNLLQAAGWSYALYLFVQHVAADSSATLWSVCGPPVYALTMLTGLEVLHSVFGMVRAGAFTTGIQVLSRVVLAETIQYVPGTQNIQPWLYCLVGAWSLTEVVRYSFYALNLVGKKVSIVTWLRYSLFIVLYPVGVAGEIGCLYTAMALGVLGAASPPDAPVLMRLFILPLFQRIPFFVFVLLAYGPGLPMLYGHMLAQRKKVLGGGRKQKVQ